MIFFTVALLMISSIVNVGQVAGEIRRSFIDWSYSERNLRKDEEDRHPALLMQCITFIF